jgi:hypothetical protein
VSDLVDGDLIPKLNSNFIGVTIFILMDELCMG